MKKLLLLFCVRQKVISFNESLLIHYNVKEMPTSILEFCSIAVLVPTIHKYLLLKTLACTVYKRRKTFVCVEQISQSKSSCLLGEKSIRT